MSWINEDDALHANGKCTRIIISYSKKDSKTNQWLTCFLTITLFTPFVIQKAKLLKLLISLPSPINLSALRVSVFNSYLPNPSALQSIC